MPSEYIECVDCQTEFEFTEEEQDRFSENKLTTPKRCKPCREKKRARNEERERREGQR